MKKLSAILLVALAFGLVSSCKPREKCPAYGKYQPKKQVSSTNS